MNNKLIELSKPVTVEPVTVETVRERLSFLEDLNARGVGIAVRSQQFEIACLRELLAAKQRIAEREERENRVVALANGNDALWDAMAHRLKTLEAKLATPVRLPQRYCISLYDDIDWEPDQNGDSFKCDEVINMLRDQGFSVVERGGE